MEAKYIKAVEEKLEIYKAANGLCLPESLDPTIIIEMGSNEEQKDLNEEETEEGGMKPKTSRCELCSPVPILCFIVIGILLAIGGLLLYSRIKHHV